MLDLLAAHGGGQPRRCAPELTTPDAGASIILLGDHVLPPIDGAPPSTTPPAAPVN